MTTKTQHPDELLAWYVNGTLSKSELQQVESHLHTCTQCQSEVKLLQTLHQHVRNEKVAGPGEIARKRLMKTIKKNNPTGRKWWEQWAAAAAVIIIAVQSIVIIDNPGTGPTKHPGTNTGEMPALSMVISDIKIRFNKSARITEINKLLLSVDTSISAGPDENNFYYLDVRRFTAKDHPQKIQAVIKQLSKHKKLQNYVDTDK
ncbi:hypothetical protein MNBD_GAMMA12-59 [hydrothermal vent metagenome]|uniref:Putative zinc-finger domain-containing protein n=1 Tax=hydrothermal vent metagenome TaxID=652676 RepID=A0A3B0YK67_9ZZZZ